MTLNFIGAFNNSFLFCLNCLLCRYEAGAGTGEKRVPAPKSTYIPAVPGTDNFKTITTACPALPAAAAILKGPFMGAGDAASEQSRRATERIVRLRRQLEHAERAAELWGAAEAGERSAADRLSLLIPGGWFLLHDVHWPGRLLANLDHVLVGPGGVVVVDSKNWTGSVAINDGILRQNGYTRQPAVEAALGQAAAVAALLAAPHRQLVRSIICLVGQPDFSGVTASGVEVLGMDRVVARVMELPAVLDQPAVVGLYSDLGQQLTQPQQPTQPQRLMQQRVPARPQTPAPRPQTPAPRTDGRQPRASSTGASHATAPHRPGTAPGSRTWALAGALWSLLIAGLVAFSLTVPYWGR